MVEIYKVIAYIPLLYQIFDDNNKNGSIKGANICTVILNLSKLLFFYVNYVMKKIVFSTVQHA